MKKFAFLLFFMMSLLLTHPLHAVTYPFPSNDAAHHGNEPVMTVGSMLYLFHSDLEKATPIEVDDVLPVYREFPADISSEARSTGKVRILSTHGQHYYQAQVVEGAMQPGFLAIKGTVACFITSAGQGGR